MPHLRHHDSLETARAINFSCYRRYSLLQSESEIMPFITELDAARRRHGFYILGYVIMPSHVHLVLLPPAHIQLGRVIGEIKARSAGAILRQWRKNDVHRLEKVTRLRNGKIQYSFWQSRCYDHNCRTPDTVREKINYCHMNPVRAGLVADPADWKWSSYRWYHGMDDVVLEIDGIDLL